MAQNSGDNIFRPGTETSFPSIADVEPRSGSPSGMSLVVAATVTRDQLDALQPTYEGRSEERLMGDQDRPILHAELRLDGCIKLDGKLGPLKSLNILVEDEDGISQLRPGSPQRTISVTMSDARSLSRQRVRGTRDELRIEDGRDIATRRQQLVWRNPNIVVEAPFNVHNYKVRMLGDQPQGLAAALTEVRPELLPPLKEPQGLQAVLLFDVPTDEYVTDQQIVEGRDGSSSADYYHDFLAQSGASETALDSFRYGYVDSKSKGHEYVNIDDGEEGKQTGSSNEIPHWRQVAGESANLQILQSLPPDLVSSLLKSHPKRFTGSEHSEGSERGGRSLPHRYSERKGADQDREGSPTRRDDHSMNVPNSGSSMHTSYFTSSDSRVNSSRHGDRGSQRSSPKFNDGPTQSDDGFKDRNSSRRLKHHSKHIDGTPGNSYTSDYMTSTAHGDGSYKEVRGRKKNSRKFLEDVSEEHKTCDDDPPPPPPPPPERHRDSRRRTRKTSHPQESVGSVSFQSSYKSGDDLRSHGSTYRTKSHSNSHQERQSSDQTRSPFDSTNNKTKETEDKILSISRLLNNMSSITQLLNNFPQPASGKSQLLNQQNSRDLQDAGNKINRPSRQFLSNNKTWSFDPNNRPSQHLIQGAAQMNQFPFESSQHAQFLDSGAAQEPSTSNNSPSQIDNSQNIRSSQMRMNVNDVNFRQFDPMNDPSTQQLNEQLLQRSSQLVNGRASSQMKPDLNFQQFNSMNQRPSQLLGNQLSHPSLHSDGSILGTVNWSSQQLNVWDDGSPQQKAMSRQKSQLQTQRASHHNVQASSAHKASTTESRQSINSRPSQVGSQDKDLQLFETMSNRASQLAIAQRQSQKLSQLQASQKFDNLNKPSLLSKQNDSFQQIVPINSHPSQMLHGRPSQIDLQGSDVQPLGDRNNHRLSQMDMQGDSFQVLNSLSTRTSHLQKNSLPQVKIQLRDSKQFQALDNQLSLLSDNRQSFVGLPDSDLQKFDAQTFSTRPSQLGTHTDDSQMFGSMNNMSRPSQLDMQHSLQFDPLNARSSHLLNVTRPLQIFMQGDGLQQVDNMNNRPSQVLNTRPSQIGVQDDNFQQYGPMNSRPSQFLNARLSQTNLQDDNGQQFNATNAQQSQLPNTRPSQMTLPDDNFQQFDAMSARPSQLLKNRQSQMNMRPSQFLTARPSQTNVQGDQQFDSIDPRSSQLMTTRPSQTGMQDQDFQQVDFMKQQRSFQLLNTRPSQMSMQDKDFQQYDSMKQPQPSQLMNSRPSQIGRQDDEFQQFDSMNQQRPSRSLDTRQSQADMIYNDLQQYDPLNPRPPLLGNTRASTMNIRQSQLLNQRPSQVSMQDDSLRQYDLVNPRQSPFLNVRSSQIITQGDDLQHYDPMNTRPSPIADTKLSQINTQQSQLLNTRPSQIGLRDEKGFQRLDHMNPHQSQLLNTRPSQVAIQDEDLQQFDSMNLQQSHLLNAIPSQIGMQYDELQQFESMSPRPSQLLDTRPSQMNLQDGNILDTLQSQFMKARPSQQPSQLANFRSSQSNLGPSLRSSMSLICDNCFDRGHEAQDCPIQVCFNCHEPGHYARTCVVPEEEYSDPPVQQEGDEDMTQQYDAGANVGSENTAQIGESQQQVLESLGTVDDSQNLETKALGLSANGSFDNSAD